MFLRKDDVCASILSALPQRGPRAVSFAELSSLLEAMYAWEPEARRPVASGGALWLAAALSLAAPAPGPRLRVEMGMHTAPIDAVALI